MLSFRARQCMPSPKSFSFSITAAQRQHTLYNRSRTARLASPPRHGASTQTCRRRVCWSCSMHPPMHNIIMALCQTPERANGRTKQKMKHCCKHIPPSWSRRTVHALLWSGQQQGYIPSHWRLRKSTYFHCLIAMWCNIHARNVFLSDRQPYSWKYAAETASLFSLCHIHFARQLQRLNIRNHLFNYFKNLPHAAQLV